MTLPRQLAARNGWQPFLIVGLPVSIFFTLEFDLPAYSALIIFGGSAVAVAYVAVLHFFVSEQFMRPVLDRPGRRTFPATSRPCARACRCGGSCSERCRS